MASGRKDGRALLPSLRGDPGKEGPCLSEPASSCGKTAPHSSLGAACARFRRPGDLGPAANARAAEGDGRSAAAETWEPLLRPVFVIPHTFRSSDGGRWRSC